MIGRIQKISKILRSEKENENKVLRPVTLTYFSPERYNPYGTSICDLIEDKQRAKSRLLNLAIMKATRNSL